MDRVPLEAGAGAAPAATDGREPIVILSWGWALVLVAALLGVGAVGLGAAAVVGRRRDRRRNPRPGQPLHAREVRARADRRLGVVGYGWTAFTGDPVRVLRLPVLADVSAPSTAAFLDALHDAEEHRRASAALDREECVLFAEAVSRAEQAWQEAREVAERVGLSRLDVDARAGVERAVELIEAADGSAQLSDTGRAAAADRARAQVAELARAGVVRLPEPAARYLRHHLGSPEPTALAGDP